MLEYALFLTKRAILQFLCNFIPFKNARKKARNAVFDKYLSDKIITLDKVDSHLPSAVLTQINAHNNEYFTTKNRQVSATIGGGKAIIATHITPKRRTLATLTLITTHLTRIHHLILGLLSAFATRLSRLGLVWRAFYPLFSAESSLIMTARTAVRKSS